MAYPCGKLNFIRRRLLSLGKQSLHELRRTPNARQRIALADKICRHDLQSLGGGGFLQALATRLRQQRMRLSIRCLRCLLLFDQRFDLVLYLGQRLHVGRLLVVHVQDDESIARIDHPAGSTLGQRLRRRLNLGSWETAGFHPAERATILGAGIFGILLGQIGKVGAALKLIQDVFRLLLSRCQSRPDLLFRLAPGVVS